MKRLLSVLLALCLLVGAMPLAYAVDGGDVDVGEAVETDGVESPAPGDSSTPETDEAPSEGQVLADVQEKTPVKVSSYEELQAAVSAAEDGDVIEISRQIIIAGSSIIETDKNITLQRSDDFTSSAYYYNAMLDVCAGGTLKGFEIVDTAKSKQTIDLSGASKVIDCHFDSTNEHMEACIHIGSRNVTDDVPIIENCYFENNSYYSVVLDYGSKGICKSCTFIHNNQAGIYNSGDIEIIDCTITENKGGGIIAYTHTTTMTNCRVYGNTVFNPQSEIGNDIYINGTLTITDNMSEEWGYYDEYTGDRIELPYEYFGSIRLICLPIDEAAEYFADKFAPEPEETNPSPAEPDTQPQEPGDNQEPQPPTEPDGNQEPPTEPGDGDTNTSAEMPQEPPTSPSEGDNDSGNDYTPPAHWWPSTPATPSTRPAPDEDIPDNDTPLVDAPLLMCGSAVIDTSRSVVLAGYGDGLLHEDDPLTRAQAAQIIYRLLTAESTGQLRTLQNAFTDCPSAAWYNEAVSTIANAGIVVGCGNGLYCPDDNLTWAQALTILTRFVEAQEFELQHITYDGWALQAVQTAAALGWIEDSADLNVNAIITRGDFVELFNGVLEMY